MKKKEIVRFPRRGKSRQIGRIMKLSVLFYFLGCMSLSAMSVAQDQRVSLELKNCTVMRLFEEIQRQTGLNFFYDQNHFQNQAPLTVKADDEAVSDVLKKLFSDQNIRFLFEDNTVIVQPAAPQQKTIKITGRVIDETGSPLPGVTVLIKGTQLGTATDIDGKYTIPVPDGNQTLIFSMIGMVDREEAVGNRTEINVDRKSVV